MSVKDSNVFLYLWLRYEFDREETNCKGIGVIYTKPLPTGIRIGLDTF